MSKLVKGELESTKSDTKKIAPKTFTDVASEYERNASRLPSSTRVFSQVHHIKEAMSPEQQPTASFEESSSVGNGEIFLRIFTVLLFVAIIGTLGKSVKTHRKVVTYIPTLSPDAFSVLLPPLTLILVTGGAYYYAMVAVLKREEESRNKLYWDLVKIILMFVSTLVYMHLKMYGHRAKKVATVEVMLPFVKTKYSVAMKLTSYHIISYFVISIIAMSGAKLTSAYITCQNLDAIANDKRSRRRLRTTF